MRVVLLENTSPQLVVLAYKVSRGKVREKGLEHYTGTMYTKYTGDKLCRYLLSAAEEWPSALEHVNFTFYIEGCSRVCSHQLVRHRHASYTQESQRYTRLCQGISLKEYVESALNDNPNDYVEEAYEKIRRQFVIPESWRTIAKDMFLVGPEEQIFAMCSLYNELIEAGVPEEDARFILPQAAKTSILMTVNLRELLHIAKLRLDDKAQWEIRRVVEEMVKQVEPVIPCIREMIDRYKG